MLEFLKVIILGIVEGITEWLPISEAADLSFMAELLHSVKYRNILNCGSSAAVEYHLNLENYLFVYNVYRLTIKERFHISNGDVHDSLAGCLCSPGDVRSNQAVLSL